MEEEIGTSVEVEEIDPSSEEWEAWEYESQW